MQIRVGIAGNEPGWTILLRQEGIPHSPVPETPAAGEFSILAASGDPGPGQIEAVRRHLANGGGAVCSGAVFEQLSPGSTKSGFTRFVLGDPEGGLFEPDLVDLFAQGEIPANANVLKSDRGNCVGFIGEFGGGQIAVLPFDPAALICDRRTGAKSFYSAGRRLPHERVSLVSKGESGGSSPAFWR